MAAVGLTMVVTANQEDQPDPTVTPAPTKIITPSPAPVVVSDPIINATPTPTPTPTPTIRPEPTFRPTPIPYNYEVAKMLGWTYGCGYTPEEYVQWYNDIHGYGPAQEYHAEVIIHDGTGQLFEPKPAQRTYAVGDQFIATVTTKCTGDPIDGLDYKVEASMYNPNSGNFVNFGVLLSNHTEILLAKNQEYTTALYRWQLPSNYMGFNATGIYDMTFSISTHEKLLHKATYEFILGTKAPDGTICL
jgi:hypothetical protein